MLAYVSLWLARPYSLDVHVDKAVQRPFPHPFELFFSFDLDVFFDTLIPAKELDHSQNAHHCAVSAIEWVNMEGATHFR